MSKAVLHNLIDMLNVEPSDDEIEAIRQAEAYVKNGDVFDISAISWHRWGKPLQ